MKYPKQQLLKKQALFAKIIPLKSRRLVTSDSAERMNDQWYYRFPNDAEEAGGFYETKMIPLVAKTLTNPKEKKREAKIIDFQLVTNH